tara:strand:+ start:6275 stop:6994 length:720 start_codon:yes stop_codon:yes gene_type:complete
MKSQQSDNNNPIKTSCKECIFAVYQEDVQIGCKFDRLEKLDHFDAYDDDKSFFVINGLCNYIRHKKNADGVEYDPSNIQQEVALSFYVIVDLDKMTKEDVEKINWEYDFPEKVTTHIFASPKNLNYAKKVYESPTMKDKNPLVTVSDIKSIEKFKKAVKGKYSFIAEIENSDQELDMQKINDAYNTDCIQSGCFKYKNTWYVSNLAYTTIGNRNGCISHEHNVEDVLSYFKEKNTIVEL